MSHLLPVFCLSALLAWSGSVQASDFTRPADTLERTFAEGGHVRLRLSAGGYTIRPSAAKDKIKVTWRTKRSRDMHRVDATADIRGREAVIRLDGPLDNFHAEIELPARTDLDVDVTVGEVDIQGIEGHKLVDLNIGEVKIDVGKAADYREACGSLKIGNLNAEPFHINKDGFFRTFSWRGEGKYTLDVRLGIGDIRLWESR